MATTQHKAVGDDGKEYVILEIRSTIHTTTLSSTCTNGNQAWRCKR